VEQLLFYPVHAITYLWRLYLIREWISISVNQHLPFPNYPANWLSLALFIWDPDTIHHWITHIGPGEDRYVISQKLISNIPWAQKPSVHPSCDLIGRHQVLYWSWPLTLWITVWTPQNHHARWSIELEPDEQWVACGSNEIRYQTMSWSRNAFALCFGWVVVQLEWFASAVLAVPRGELSGVTDFVKVRKVTAPTVAEQAAD